MLRLSTTKIKASVHEDIYVRIFVAMVFMMETLYIYI